MVKNNDSENKTEILDIEPLDETNIELTVEKPPKLDKRKKQDNPKRRKQLEQLRLARENKKVLTWPKKKKESRLKTEFKRK